MNPVDRLIALDRESPKSIAVVGDLMIDRWHIGTVGECQEYCRCFRTHEVKDTPGGAANAARQLCNWRRSAVRFLGTFDIQLALPSCCCTKNRYLDRHGGTVWRTDANEDLARKPICPEHLIHLLQQGKFDAVLISDYDKGELTEKAIREVILYCIKNDIPCVADGKRAPEIYAGAILKVNEEYISRFAVSACSNLSPATVVTFGAEKPIVFSEEGTIEEFPVNAKPVPCVNHVGAGDCFAAHLTLALAHKLSLADAVTAAHTAGRVFVQHGFGRPPWPHEMRKDIDPLGGKVLQAHGLAALRESSGGRIVFSNGVFRLVHAGHAAMLHWARQQGDVLVVGVNSDRSLSQLRPAELTVLPESQRVGLLAAMECVDWIVPFDELTPLSVIEALKPDTLVKGPDYEKQQVVGANVVADVRIAPTSPYKEHATDLMEFLGR